MKLITSRNAFLLMTLISPHVVRLFIAALQMGGGGAGNKEQLRQRLREKVLIVVA